MDKMREEFELWMSTTGRVDFSKIDDIYASRDTFFMWQAWQASRKALVVELPVAFPVCDDKDSAEVAYVLDILEKLALAGVSYK